MEFKLEYTPQDKQQEYHAIGSGRFVKFMPYLYNGFPMSDKIEAEKPLEERLERYKRGELTMLEQYIVELDNLIHEAVYGGARGGGKSYADSGEAGMLANIFPGIKVGIFRQTLGALNDSITDKLLNMLPKKLKDKKNGWKYQKKDNHILYQHNDSVIKLNYCENYQDALKYRGREYDIIIVDEECDLDNKTVNFLKSTLRTAKFIKFEDGTPCRYPIGHKNRYFIDKDGNVTKKLNVVNYPSFYRASVNPEGPGFIRVRDTYVYPTDYGKKVVEEKLTKNNGQVVIRRKAFIQALMIDNQYLNDDYEFQFKDMTKEERAKNVDGNWDVSDTNFFRKFRESIHTFENVEDLLTNEQKSYVKDGFEFPEYFECYGALDWGFYPDYAALGIWFMGDDLVVKRFEFIWQNKAINQASLYILELQEKYNFKMKALAIPHDMAKKGENYQNTKGEIIGFTKENVLNHYGIPTVVTTGRREDGWDKVHQLQAERNEDGSPLVRYHKSCIKTISGYQTLSRDPIKYKDIRDGQEDHCADSDRYLAVMYSKYLNTRKKIIQEKSWRQKLIEKNSSYNTQTTKHNFSKYMR